MSGKRVIAVTGSRDRAPTREQLAEDLAGCELLIVGDCRGTDLAAFAYARDVLGLSVDAGTIRVHYANDHGTGNGRFLRRNDAIAIDALGERKAGSDVRAVGYPCKASRGTWHCIRALTARGIAPKVVRL